MSQKRRESVNLSPSTNKIRPPSTKTVHRSESFQVKKRNSIIETPVRAVHQQAIFNQNIPQRSLSRLTQTLPQTSILFTSSHTLEDPIIGLSSDITTRNEKHRKENSAHSTIINSSYNNLLSRERPINSFTTETQYSFQRPILNNNNSKQTEENGFSSVVNDDDQMSIASNERNHLPIFARFPFDVTFLPRPMDTNVEDNVHKLRLRLIDSELNHQRRSTDDYIKRTHRIGMENDIQNTYDIERDLEIRRIHDSLNSGRRSNQQLMLPNYSYDPRLHMQPLNERQYSSSNMDDLIDSMARRQLAYRRREATFERPRYPNGSFYGPYLEQSGLVRRPSLLSQQRNEELYIRNPTATSRLDHDFLRTNLNSSNQIIRSRVEYYNPIQPDYDVLPTNNIIRTNSYAKLPPISPGIDSNFLPRTTQNPIYQTTQHIEKQRNYQQPLSLNLPQHNEHLIELPSDIFTARTEPVGSAQRQQQTRKIESRTISKDRSDSLADSETDPSDGENQTNLLKYQQNFHKQQLDKRKENGHDEFFTEGSSRLPSRKAKIHRNLFRKAAVGIFFIYVLKKRAAKSRLTRPHQTLSATIHKIRLQEIMVALHRVYLEPDGPIYNALIQAITSPVQLKDALDKTSKNHLDAINVIGEAVKNVISRIVDFMPKDGILGTAKSSAVAALIQDGNPFPENYFWQCEMELLEFHKSKIINVTKQRATLLLIGIFIFRALVTTLLLKPIKYRLILGQLTTNQSASLKVLASVMLYVGRQAAKSIPQILTLPHELELSLYRDVDIQPIIQHGQIKPIITKCELSLRVWCEEYIRRIDESFGKELRT